jgi:hypothetical protein
MLYYLRNYPRQSKPSSDNIFTNHTKKCYSDPRIRKLFTDVIYEFS